MRSTQQAIPHADPAVPETASISAVTTPVEKPEPSAGPAKSMSAPNQGAQHKDPFWRYFAAGAAALFIFGLTVGWGVGDKWGADQWGDLATWLAGFATTAAVMVTVWQTNNANKQARAAEKRAEDDAKVMAERHRMEMEAADKRLAHELDSARRIEQIRTIPPIWDAFGQLAVPYVDFKGVMETAHRLPRTKASADKLKAQVQPWINGMRNLELAFTTPVLMVSEPHTQKAITDLYEKVRKLQELTNAELKETMVQQRPYNKEPIDELFKEIAQSRKTMTNTVREHLAQVPPLWSADELALLKSSDDAPTASV